MNIKSVSNSTKNAIRRALGRNTNPVIIGDADGNVSFDLDPASGLVYARRQQADGTWGPRFLVRGSTAPGANQPGIPVELGIDRQNRQNVTGPDFAGMQAQGINPTQYSTTDPNANNSSFVNQSFITTAYGQIVAGTLYAAIRGWLILDSTGVFKKIEGQVGPLTVPSAGLHGLAVIAVQSDAITFEVQYSTAKDIQIPLDLSDLNEAWALMSSPTTNAPLWAFELADSQTTIIESDRWADLRQMINFTMGGGGGTGDVTGPSSAVSNDFVMFDGVTGKLVKDNGTSLTTDGTLAGNSDSLIPSEKAVKTYVDGHASAAIPESIMAVQLVAISNINIASPGATIDSTAPTGTNPRILLTNQSTPSQSGPWIWHGAAVPLTRPTDYPSGGTTQAYANLAVFVTDGTTGNKDSVWVITTTGAITIDTTSVSWSGQSLLGANTALSNLASTAFNVDIVPSADITENIGSSTKRVLNGFIQFPLSDTMGRAVKNVSGSTANATEVGYMQYDVTNGWSYTTTTTALLVAQWCVVLVGGANNATIYVATAGTVTVKLNANCAIGNLLTTSTTAGSAAVRTSPHYAMFAVCTSANAGGAGGTCTARLLCGTTPVVSTNANYIHGRNNVSTNLFTSTINNANGLGGGTLSATNVPFGTVLTGNKNVLVPNTAGQLGLMRLWNTTRGTFRLITSTNNTTQAITTVSSTDAWANTDALTIESQTVNGGAVSEHFTDIDLNNANNNNVAIPYLTRAVLMYSIFYDTAAGVGTAQVTHPFETFASSKQTTLYGQVAGTGNAGLVIVQLEGQVFDTQQFASGAGTAQTAYSLAQLFIASEL